MSEYWKSTPKYWCKHCKTYVRDTKLEKTSHDATPKHPGNLKRFLRDLHCGHERDERDKQRAKDEVEGLNGVVSGSSGSAAEGSTIKADDTGREKVTNGAASCHGVAVPEDFRRELALAGGWQTLSERPVNSKALKKEEDDDDVKPSNLNIGVRKRKFEGEEEEEEAGESVLRRGWGSTKRTFPCDGEDDLDTLLERTRVVRRRDEALRDAGSCDAKESSLDLPERRIASTEGMKESPKGLTIKEEELMGFSLDLAAASEHGLIDASVFKTEDDSVGSGVVFKKRKPKHLRQK
ncbi:MAG: hypothetical protein FRX48_01222 [Lasallia pustulata]|uniref:U1-type domain-containing protein n=1 Tax=Lasallia pustulata TaxID=136370 RepID=A0A5M8PXQ4_9LECA|nr:MAG: hypothetical protein FRX48_01222 [Lasallia pustulata]